MCVYAKTHTWDSGLGFCSLHQQSNSGQGCKCMCTPTTHTQVSKAKHFTWSGPAQCVGASGGVHGEEVLGNRAGQRARFPRLLLASQRRCSAGGSSELLRVHPPPWGRLTPASWPLFCRPGASGQHRGGGRSAGTAVVTAPALLTAFADRGS